MGAFVLILCLVAFSLVLFKGHSLRNYLVSWGWVRTLDKEDINVLDRYFGFYRSLPAQSKKIFEYRVARFIRTTRFIPRGMPRVTPEMKTLISASAIQLTFGFRDVLLSHFKRILVYPDQYFSPAAQRHHKGEVNPALGVIVLSWKHFVEGYALDEGVNLGLHEMAHALQLENVILNDEFGFMNDEDIARWQALAHVEIEKINSQKASFFRDYGGTNQHEFFAVAVENFFERPRQFHDYHPELYLAMCRLLRQNPLVLLENPH